MGVVDAVEERDEGGDGEGVIEEGEEVLVGEQGEVEFVVQVSVVVEGALEVEGAYLMQRKGGLGVGEGVELGFLEFECLLDLF